MKFGCKLISGLIFSGIFFFPALSKSSSSEVVHILIIADQFYESENYDASITEYLRFSFFARNHPYLFYAFYKTGRAYGKLNEWTEAAYYLEQSLKLATKPDMKHLIRYHWALALIANQDLDLAKIELFKLANSSAPGYLKNSARLMLGVLYIQNSEWEKAGSTFSDFDEFKPDIDNERACFNEIKNLLFELENDPKKKSPKLAKWFSTFIPGSGQIYAGKWLIGLNAIALNSATSYFLWETYERRNVRDFLLVFSFIWLRYYNGNRLVAEQAAIESNQIYKEKLVHRIIELIILVGNRLEKKQLTIEWSQLPALYE